MSKKTKKLIVGIAMILAAMAGAAIAVFDDDPNTKVDVKETIEKVNEGVDTIKDANTPESDEAAPEVPTEPAPEGE